MNHPTLLLPVLAARIEQLTERRERIARGDNPYLDPIRAIEARYLASLKVKKGKAAA